MIIILLSRYSSSSSLTLTLLFVSFSLFILLSRYSSVSWYLLLLYNDTHISLLFLRYCSIGIVHSPIVRTPIVRIRLVSLFNCLACSICSTLTIDHRLTDHRLIAYCFDCLPFDCSTLDAQLRTSNYD